MQKRVKVLRRAVEAATRLSAVPRASVPEAPSGSSLVKPSKKAWDISLTTPGMKLLKPITITLRYLDADVPNMNKAKLKLAYWDEPVQVWRVIENSVSYPAENKVVGDTSHLSVFGVVEFAASTSTASNQVLDAYNFPNPFNPDSGTTIRYILDGRAQEVKIKIYDIQGRLLKEIAGTTNADINDAAWDGRNNNGKKVGLEVFICKIEVSSDAGKTVKTIKIASWR